MRILWSIAWITGLKILEGCGMIYPKTLGWMIVEALLCCFAAWIFARHPVIRIIGIIYLIVSLILNFNIVGIYCFSMSILLLAITINKHKNEG